MNNRWSVIVRNAKFAMLSISLTINIGLNTQTAQAAESNDAVVTTTAPLVIIVHVDAMPPFTEAATELLRKYRRESLKESGVKNVLVLQQLGRPNHYTIFEEWENQKAYNAHVSATTTREFRANLQSMLGAPFDERPHYSLE